MFAVATSAAAMIASALASASCGQCDAFVIEEIVIGLPAFPSDGAIALGLRSSGSGSCRGEQIEVVVKAQPVEQD